MAKLHRVPISQLLSANPALDPDNLVSGQKIVIPPSQTETDPPCPSGIFWVVTPGDTLYSIAQAAGVDLADLVAANPGVDPLDLRPGQSLCLPPRAIVPPEIPPCASGVFWVVEPGDTLFKIAQATGFTVDELLAVNPGLDPNNLQPRTNICLPAG
ncbi:MAG: LysM peptidoglycan-binding domain-containing protein [Firmicutes bacterium]|nr:LysM peptidoglycan-binding domain-containing protein [Bacillota bacterium]